MVEKYFIGTELYNTNTIFPYLSKSIIIDILHSTTCNSKKYYLLINKCDNVEFVIDEESLDKKWKMVK